MTANKSNLILIGMPGCGKSTIGKKLADIIKRPFIDVDEQIESFAKRRIPEIFKQGEDYFRDIETQVIYALEKEASTIISTGGGVVKREENIRSLKKNGVIIFINRHPDNIIKDIDTTSRPLLSNKKEQIFKLYQERVELYKKHCDIEIINDTTLENCLKRLICIYEEMNLL